MDALSRAYLETVARADALERHAQAAPQEASAKALSRLAEAAGQQVEALATALRAANAPLPAQPATSGLAAGSHWGRLVADLEAHRDAAQRYREVSTAMAMDTPASAAIIEGLLRHCEEQCRELRTLIARADPQARD